MNGVTPFSLDGIVRALGLIVVLLLAGCQSVTTGPVSAIQGELGTPVSLVAAHQPLPEPAAAPAAEQLPPPVTTDPGAEFLAPVDPTTVWNLEELEDLALRSSPALARSASRVGVNQGRWEQVGLWPNPDIGYSGQQLGSRGLAEQQGALVGGEIVTGHKLALNRQVAAQEIVKSEQEWNAMRLRVLTDVRLAYYDALIAERRSELTRTLHEISQQSVKTAGQLFDAKEGSKIDWLQAQLEAGNAEISMRNAENRLDACWRHLAAVVGVPGLPRRTLVGPLDPPSTHLDWERTVQTLVEVSPEVAAAHAEIDRAGWALDRARAEVIPNIRAQGIVQTDNSVGGTNGMLQVTVPVPIFNRNQGAIAAAEAELAGAKRELMRVELALTARLATVFERYSNASQQYELYSQQLVPHADEQLKLVQKAYAAGEFAYLALLVAQRSYFQTHLARLESLRELRVTVLEVDGMLLRGSLETPDPR